MEEGKSLEPSDRGGSSLVFLGTGSSSCTPYALCLLQPTDPPCEVCFKAISSPPIQNPDYRCNPSLLIDYCSGGDEHKYIVIDVGKTFKEQVLRWFVYHKIPRLDSIILTHEHADAAHGLDDVCLLQTSPPGCGVKPTPVYLNQFSMDRIAKKFEYLVQKKMKYGGEVQDVANIEWNIIDNSVEKPFVASGLQFFPLPVKHGEDYVSLGFLFGEKARIAYISDVSRIPESTENAISKYGAGQVDLLILDSNTTREVSSRSTHFCFRQTLEAVKKICPKRALLVGMSHDFDHFKHNNDLMEWSRKEGIPVELAHDGLRLFVNL